MYYYLPGCDVAKNHPEAVRKMTKFLTDKGLKIAPCCRKDVSYLTDEDVIVQNCTLCELMFNEQVPNTTNISLYSYLLSIDFDWPNYNGKTVTIQDCFRTKDNRVLQDDVRKCLTKMNINYVEVKDNFEKTTYCGVWLNNPAFPDCEVLAPNTFRQLDQYRHLLPEQEQIQNMKQWVKQYETEEIVVYCNGCEKGLKLGEAKPLHMIELLTRDLA